MNKEQLERWRSLGFDFPGSFYDGIAEREEEREAAGEIISVSILGTPPFQYNDVIRVEIISKNIKGKTVSVSLLDNDRVFSSNKGNDTTLWHKNSVAIIGDRTIVGIKLTLNMRNLAHKKGETEFNSAEYYAKVESKEYGTFYSEEVSVDYKFSIRPNQKILTPDGNTALIEDDAIPILNNQKQTLAFLTPDEKVFIYIDDGVWKGYFDDGMKRQSSSYNFRLTDYLQRQENPITWGLYLTGVDVGEFMDALLGDFSGTLTALIKGITKILSLDFSISETWDSIQKADLTDASHNVSMIMISSMAGPKGLKLIKSGDMKKFIETIQSYLQKEAKKITWKELLEIFRKALIFEANITKELLKKYPIEEGYIHISRLYLRANNAVSIVDNCIFNTKTGKWILNETKYGISNRLSKNQSIIEKAIKEGVGLEIRTATRNLPDVLAVEYNLSQGSTIFIDEILRSHSIDGSIISNTIQNVWKK